MAAVILALCIPVYAEDGLTMDEATGIILEHHGAETETETGVYDVSGYLTLDAGTMTREAAVAAVVRSYGVYPVDEPDHIWTDEAEQGEAYRPYIDYARRMGITEGVGGGCFSPGRPVTEWELRTMLDRADGIQPVYPLSYDSPLCKILSADTQYGLSLVPDSLMDRFYAEGRTITVTTSPIMMDGVYLSERYVGWTQYEGDMWLAVACNNYPYYDQKKTAIHEMGHYLGYRTNLLNRFSVSDERHWLMDFFRDYCNESDQEFFADSFTAFILWPDELKENAPTVFAHIQQCLEEMENRYE